MNWIKLFEDFTHDINSYLKESTFDELPLDFKKGLLTYMVQGDPVEWTYNGAITDWINGENVIEAIADYSREKGKRVFRFGFVPTNLIIEKLTPIIVNELGYESFEQWHEWYQSSNPANHGDSLFPVLVNDYCDEWIEDGWHRFNYYLSKGIKNIPVVDIT